MGGHVYASYNPWNPDDKKLLHWLNNVVAHAPGIHLTVKKRKPKSAPSCQACHRKIEICPHCGEKIRRTGEKGIDTGLVTDLIMGAWEDAYDTAVLVSSDADFIPAVRFIQTKGKRVIHACFPPSGAELQRECWSSVNLAELVDQMPKRTDSENQNLSCLRLITRIVSSKTILMPHPDIQDFCPDMLLGLKLPSRRPF